MFDFSIIIPVYNAEKTIDRCLNSIKNQTYPNYEVIIIDDGSTDRSAEMCNEYISKATSWKIITQNNSGPSKARNVGLELAKGEYICFIDSDDWVEKIYLETLHKTIKEKNPDVIFFGYEKEVSGKKLQLYIPENDMGRKKEDICLRLSEKELFGYTWVKCFSSKAIGNKRFNEKLNLLEDEVFTLQVIKECTNIEVIPAALYHYIIGSEAALTGRTHIDYCLKMDNAYHAWAELLYESEYLPQLIHKANVFTSICRFYGLERELNVKDYFEQLKETQFFKDHTNENDLDKMIRAGQYAKISLKRKMYRLKQAAYKKIKNV